MKGKCIDDEIWIIDLKIKKGKIYNILGEKKSSYLILNDENKLIACDKTRFKIIKENEMKEYTYVEVIQELLDDNTKQFKKIGTENIIKLSNDGYISVSDTVIFSATHHNLNSKYTLIDKSVTWQEAFKAGLEGKRIKAKGWEGYCCIETTIKIFNLATTLVFESLIDGEWYIED